MTGRMCLLMFVAASTVVHTLSSLPEVRIQIGLLVCSFIFFALSWRLTGRWRTLCWILVAGLLGFLVAAKRAEYRLADALHVDNENKVSRVELRIVQLPRHEADSRHFQAEVISSRPPGVPSRIQVSWSAPGWSGPFSRGRGEPADFPELIPGQRWRMALTLKSPHGARNPRAFDYEGHVFAQGVRALGSVRGTPEYLGDDPWASLSIVAQRARYRVRQAMQPYLQDFRYGAVLVALAIGDQAGVPAPDWQIFNRSGLTHLVSISGSHITMIAALAALVISWFWRRVRFGNTKLAERIPVQVAAAWAALLVAWLYCLLAGWGVPARRTFLMLSVVAFARIVRLPLGASHIVSLAAFLVVLMDPWALLSTGFWLSFGAVCVLLASSSWFGHDLRERQAGWGSNVRSFVLTAGRLQWAISLALLPMLAAMFNEVSLVSPLANAYAIALIGMVVTPAALLLAGFALIPGAESLASWVSWLGHGVMQLLMRPTIWLAELEMASVVIPSAPPWLTVLALAGVVIAAMPYGFPQRRLGWLLMLPALCWRAERPLDGDWTLYALDVGQAGAAVVQTAHHTLVFDSGMRRGPDSEDGERIIWPFLKTLGVRKVDVLVISHADLDHAGGVWGILKSIPVEQSFSSFDLRRYVRREAAKLEAGEQLPVLPLAISPCRHGMRWMIDGVSFEFLWPVGSSATEPWGKHDGRNAESCVLRVQGARHSLLLTGDIGVNEERILIDRGVRRTDVVMAAHHGSKSSSSQSWIDAVQASDVVAQAGRFNRYGHPHDVVQKRWERAGIRFWRNDHHGAVTISSSRDGLHVDAQRLQHARYWTSRPE
jgi:competence protein ComEC